MRWRLIELELADGPTNMAKDEAILEVMTKGTQQPTVRIYGWNEACLSLGSAETSRDLDLAACRDQSVRILRRSSGGTAVLHQAQLAFSLIAPEKHPVMAGSIHESYRQVSRPVLLALRTLGIEGRAIGAEEAKEVKQNADPRWNAACLASMVAYEIFHGGRKIAAHSQTRRRNMVLHHGVILLDFSPASMAACLSTKSAEDKQQLIDYLKDKVSSCREITGGRPAIEELAKALKKGFSQAWEIDLVPGGLTEEEEALCSRLLETKYLNDAWTFRR